MITSTVTRLANGNIVIVCDKVVDTASGQADLDDMVTKLGTFTPVLAAAVVKPGQVTFTVTLAP